MQNANAKRKRISKGNGEEKYISMRTITTRIV